MKRIFAAVYVLVLVTQLPHVAAAYADLERAGWYQWTAWAAAVAFEASIAAFTYRIVVERSRRRTTRVGLGFFLVASAVANATYYSLAPAAFAVVMPMFATLALPVSLALFASEFGAEVNDEEAAVQREQRRQARLERSQSVTESVTASDEREDEPQLAWVCPSCNRSFRSQNALNSHGPRRCAEVRRNVADTLYVTRDGLHAEAAEM